MAKKILIVDDSVFMLRLLSDIIAKEPEFELVGKAVNGKQAVELNARLKPDVVLLDVEMPVMNGLDALQEIMKTRPTAVIMFSSLTKKDGEITLKALELGATDFILKPQGKAFDLSKDVIDEIVIKLKHVRANSSVIPRPGTFTQNRVQTEKKIGSPRFKKLVAIGTSTGGPRALQDVLTEVRADIDGPIVIVQHMPKLFTKQFADRLNSLCVITVKEAEQGETLLSGTAYIAPGDRHLRVVKTASGYKADLEAGEKVSGHIPSVDAMFSSLINVTGLDITAIMMTGMGRDGAESMKKLHDKGILCICQDEKTSVVYGMPKSAAELGAANKIVPLNKIAAEINTAMEV